MREEGLTPAGNKAYEARDRTKKKSNSFKRHTIIWGEGLFSLIKTRGKKKRLKLASFP